MEAQASSSQEREDSENAHQEKKVPSVSVTANPIAQNRARHKGGAQQTLQTTQKQPSSKGQSLAVHLDTLPAPPQKQRQTGGKAAGHPKPTSQFVTTLVCFAGTDPEHHLVLTSERLTGVTCQCQQLLLLHGSSTPGPQVHGGHLATSAPPLPHWAQRRRPGNRTCVMWGVSLV